MAFMTHPKHGATITNDVAEHEKNGWSISTTLEWLAGKAETAKQCIDGIEQVAIAIQDAPKKRGPKPKAQ